MFSIVFSIIFITPILLWRLIRRKPIFPKGEKLKSPNILYMGAVLFGGVGLLLILYGMPYFGSFFIIIMIAYVFGLVFYSKGWRG